MRVSWTFALQTGVTHMRGRVRRVSTAVLVDNGSLSNQSSSGLWCRPPVATITIGIVMRLVNTRERKQEHKSSPLDSTPKRLRTISQGPNDYKTLIQTRPNHPDERVKVRGECSLKNQQRTAMKKEREKQN